MGSSNKLVHLLIVLFKDIVYEFVGLLFNVSILFSNINLVILKKGISIKFSIGTKTINSKAASPDSRSTQEVGRTVLPEGCTAKESLQSRCGSCKGYSETTTPA